MGFVMLGLMTLTAKGLSGAVLQMFSHGIIASLLFGVVGRMIYDRTHTRELTLLEGMRLSKTMPFAAVTFTVAAFASMGLPGFSGFVAELQVLAGAWAAFPKLTLLAGVGVVIGVAFTLRAMQMAFFGEGAPTVSQAESDAHPLEPITVPERMGAVVLMGLAVLIGLWPRVLLDWIIPSFDSPLFAALKKGGFH